jgi:uracil-DNA glycosylase
MLVCMNPDKVNIEGQWKQFLLPFLMSSRFDDIYAKLREDHANGAKIHPASANFWKPFKCPYDDLKVVLIADGPYNKSVEKKGTEYSLADGLPLSTGIYNDTTKLLEDCWYSCIEQDIFDGMNLSMFLNPDLMFLVEQGMLMLNSSFTAIEGNSHFSLWEPFIAYLIEHALNPYPMKLLFLLIGEEAQLYRKYVSEEHVIIECEHPQTALNEKRSWNFNNIFSKTNQFLKNERNEEIMWVEQVPI